jgi:hypothetical protein
MENLKCCNDFGLLTVGALGSWFVWDVQFFVDLVGVFSNLNVSCGDIWRKQKIFLVIEDIDKEKMKQYFLNTAILLVFYFLFCKDDHR